MRPPHHPGPLTRAVPLSPPARPSEISVQYASPPASAVVPPSPSAAEVAADTAQQVELAIVEAEAETEMFAGPPPPADAEFHSAPSQSTPPLPGPPARQPFSHMPNNPFLKMPSTAVIEVVASPPPPPAAPSNGVVEVSALSPRTTSLSAAQRGSVSPLRVPASPPSGASADVLHCVGRGAPPLIPPCCGRGRPSAISRAFVCRAGTRRATRGRAKARQRQLGRLTGPQNGLA